MANGPLAGAALGLHNALVLHEVENMASCFIHLTPMLVTWTMRWKADKYDEAYPGVFAMQNFDYVCNFNDFIT